MPFTDQQKDGIRTYLGYSTRFFQVDSILEQAMDNVGDDAIASVTVLDFLQECIETDCRIREALKRQRYTDIDGEIKYAGPRELAMLRGYGRQYAGRLAAKFGVQVRHDAFGTGLSNDSPGLAVGMFNTGPGGNTPRFG